MEAGTRRVAVGLGANLGAREATLRAAFARMRAMPGTANWRLSRLYESEPWGLIEQPAFLNAVAVAESTRTPGELLRELLAIETELGRVRAETWGPRLIDLDLLLVSDECLDTLTLSLPHPHLDERRFVLEPLAELLPDWRHPKLGRTIRELLAELRDPSWVRAIGEIAAPEPLSICE